MRLSPTKFIKEKVEEIRKTVVEGKRALVAVSGGVDSVVASFISYRAIPENLVVLFLDDGLMRENEGKQINEFFARKKIELQIWDVQRNFFDALKEKVDPEEKRKAFRDVFYKTLGQALKSYSCEFLIQGTIAADIVETQKGIKTQHNVLSQIGINPAFYGLQIIEPLRELYKPQVRRLAKMLGMPKKYMTENLFLDRVLPRG